MGRSIKIGARPLSSRMTHAPINITVATLAISELGCSGIRDIARKTSAAGADHLRPRIGNRQRKTRSELSAYAKSTPRQIGTAIVSTILSGREPGGRIRE